MAVAGVKDIRAVGQLKCKDLVDGIGKDKTGEPYLQRFRQGLGQFVLRVQLAGKDLAYILQEQKIV